MWLVQHPVERQGDSYKARDVSLGGVVRNPFVGRHAELEQLSLWWTQVSDGRFRCALIAGEGGAGKSSLTGAFISGLSDCRWVRVEGDEAERGLPFAGHDQLFDQLAEVQAASAGEGIELERRPGLPGRDPFVEGASLLQRLVDVCHFGPLAVVIDDVDLLDGPSLSSLAFALRRFRQGRLLVVMTARSASVLSLPRGLRGLMNSNGDRIDLGGLSRADVQSLSNASGFGRLSERAAERLREHTNGNPLHLRALMSDLTLRQAERLDVPLPAPRSLAMQVLGTLGQTSEDAQRLASAAAVLGSQPRLSEVALLADLDDACSAMEALQQAHLAEMVESDCDVRIAFVHPLVRAAVYDDLKAARRSQLHARAADLTRGDASLRHRVRAASGAVSPGLVPALTALAERHCQVGAYTAAAEAMFDACRLSERSTVRDRLLLQAVDLLVYAGDLSRATCYTDMVSQLPEDAYRLQVQARMAWLAGRHDEAEVLARRAWTFSDRLGDRARDDVATMVAQMCIMRGDGNGAGEWAKRALESGSLAPGAQEATLACAAIAAALVGRLDDGLAVLPADDSRAERSKYQPLWGARGMLRLWGDDATGAVRDLRSAAPVTTALSAASGGPYGLVFHLYLAEAEYRCGNWDTADDLAQQGVALIEDLGQGWLSTFGHAVAALVPSGRGEWQAAAGHVAAAQKAAQELGDQPSRAYADNAAVHLAACRGDAAAVVAAAGWLVANPGTHHEPGFFGWPLEHVSALVQLGRMGEAETRLTDIESLARSRGRRSVVAQVARLRAEFAAANRDTSVARALFHESDMFMTDPCDALESAVRQASFGRFLRRRGERRAAREKLADARDRFRALGAGPFLQRVEEELARCGQSTPSGRVDSLPALTAQERAVAQLVCAGRSNREVANDLSVSVKTVSYHLGNVYIKFGVHSRTELAARLTAGLLTS